MSNAIWNLRATTVDQMNGFQDVITEVHWTLTVQRGGMARTRSGSVLLPPPVSQESYIDLAAILEMPRKERRATVLGFAEIIRPGFVADQVAALGAEIDGARGVPVETKISIL